mmetsp:Transcript_20478/g.29205  ORF Transcript_20478/g.29205 Transcript_20478/m.29205 type:complete len:205 (-) Transcript_20478:284-898(-)
MLSGDMVPNCSKKKNTSGTERAPLGCIDPNAHNNIRSNCGGKNPVREKKSGVKKQRILRTASPPPSLLTRSTSEEIKLSSSENSLILNNEISESKLNSAEEEENIHTIGLVQAKPVIDPDDSLEYENELKMLEEFYQGKAHEMAKAINNSTLNVQPVSREEEIRVNDESIDEINEGEKEEYELSNSSEAIYRDENDASKLSSEK